MERPERTSKQPQRYADVPTKGPLMLGEMVTALWKDDDYKGDRFPARVVKVNEQDDSYGIVFVDEEGLEKGHRDDKCAAKYIWRGNGVQATGPLEAAGAEAERRRRKTKRKKRAAGDGQLYVPWYGDIKSVSLHMVPVTAPVAKRLKFQVENGLYMHGELVDLPDKEISLQDMMCSAEFAPSQFERDLFAGKIGAFMKKLLDTPPSPAQHVALLAGL